jgi:hypothetical protein
MTNSVTGSLLPAWPGDARAGCAFTFDLDAETLWMARGISAPVTLSQGRFGVLDHVRHTPRVRVVPLAEISAHWRRATESTA